MPTRLRIEGGCWKGMFYTMYFNTFGEVSMIREEFSDAVGLRCWRS